MNVAADDVDVLQIRQPLADFAELVPAGLIRDDGFRAGIGEAEFQRILAEQREQRHRDEARTERREMRHRQFQRLRQKHADAIAALQAVRLQHVGEAAREIAQLVEAGVGDAAVRVEIDQRQFSRAIGMAVAGGGRDVEARRHLPAEIAIEFVVVGGLGEHGRAFFFTSPRSLPGEVKKFNVYPVSAAFTRPLALPKSICPAYFAFSAPITLPMSLIPAAPVSVMVAAIAAFTSSSDICFGR